MNVLTTFNPDKHCRKGLSDRSNRDAISFLDSIVQGHGILYETAGTLGKNGERIFITAKLPDYIRIGRGDMIERYLFLTNSHDGSGSITAAFTPIRAVYRNTLNAAMRNLTNVVRIRNTATVKLRLELAHKVMGMACKFSQEIEPVFNRWTNVRITDKKLRTDKQPITCVKALPGMEQRCI